MENNPLCQLHKTEELCRLSVQQNGCSLKYVTNQTIKDKILSESGNCCNIM